jgi:hydrogenase expression/formation protein HypC
MKNEFGRASSRLQETTRAKEEKNLAETCRSCLAIPGRIVELSPADSDSAMAEALGMRRKIDVTLIQDGQLAPGDWVLIHVGFAMSKITEEDAMDRLRTLELLEEREAAAIEFCGYEQVEQEAKAIPVKPRMQP